MGREFSRKLPNKKKRLLTKEFMLDFLENLKEVFGDNACKGLLLRTECFGFYEALRKTCEKHNLKKSIYDYFCKLPWYISGYYEEDFVLLFDYYSIVDKSVLEDYDEGHFTEKEMFEFGMVKKITTTQHKGYSSIVTDWTYKEIEERYKDNPKDGVSIKYIEQEETNEG